MLVLQPRVLLLDEPLGALDLKLRKDMQIELKKIQQQVGITFIYVTHDQEEALTMSDRIMVMNRGKVEQIGAPLDIYSDPSSLFVADFIGQANIIPGKVLSAEGGAVSVSLPDIRVSVRAVKDASFVPGDEAAVVVRPENLLPSSGDGMKGTILTATFLGGRMEYEVALESGRTVLSFDPFLPGKRMWAEGEAVSLLFDPAVAVALKA